MNDTLKLVGFDVEQGSASQHQDLGHRPRRFKTVGSGRLLTPGPFATLMAYEVMCSVTDSSKALTPFQTICAPIQTRRNDESFIITDIPV
jgi:hypothetical protein